MYCRIRDSVGPARVIPDTTWGWLEAEYLIGSGAAVLRMNSEVKAGFLDTKIEAGAARYVRGARPTAYSRGKRANHFGRSSDDDARVH